MKNQFSRNVNNKTNTSIINKKFLQIDSNYVLYSFFKKNTQFETPFSVIKNVT